MKPRYAVLKNLIAHYTPSAVVFLVCVLVVSVPWYCVIRE